MINLFEIGVRVSGFNFSWEHQTTKLDSIRKGFIHYALNKCQIQDSLYGTNESLRNITYRITLRNQCQG